MRASISSAFGDNSGLGYNRNHETTVRYTAQDTFPLFSPSLHCRLDDAPVVIISIQNYSPSSGLGSKLVYAVISASRAS